MGVVTSEDSHVNNTGSNEVYVPASESQQNYLAIHSADTQTTKTVDMNDSQRMSHDILELIKAALATEPQAVKVSQTSLVSPNAKQTRKRRKADVKSVQYAGRKTKRTPSEIHIVISKSPGSTGSASDGVGAAKETELLNTTRSGPINAENRFVGSDPGCPDLVSVVSSTTNQNGSMELDSSVNASTFANRNKRIKSSKPKRALEDKRDSTSAVTKGTKSTREKSSKVTVVNNEKSKLKSSNGHIEVNVDKNIVLSGCRQRQPKVFTDYFMGVTAKEGGESLVKKFPKHKSKASLKSKKSANTAPYNDSVDEHLLDQDEDTTPYSGSIDEPSVEKSDVAEKPWNLVKKLVAEALESSGLYCCPHCDFTTRSKTQLKSHTNSHSATLKPVTCDICDHVSNGQAVHNAHMKSHCEQSYLCHLCPFETRQKSAMIMHKKVHSADVEFCCEECSFTTKYRNSLVLHKRAIHTNERPHACEFCSFVSTNTSNLTQHMRSHTDVRPYSCAECGKAFRTQNVLVEHLKIHADVYPHKCGICSKSFRQKAGLIRHEQQHMNTGAIFACHMCGQEFRQKANLKRHLLVHSDEKIFSCADCSQSFKTKDNLTRHVRCVHEKSREFKCYLCNKMFVNRRDVVLHLRRVHRAKKANYASTSDSVGIPVARKRRKKACVVYSSDEDIKANMMETDSNNAYSKPRMKKRKRIRPCIPDSEIKCPDADIEYDFAHSLFRIGGGKLPKLHLTKCDDTQEYTLLFHSEHENIFVYESSSGCFVDTFATSDLVSSDQIGDLFANNNAKGSSELTNESIVPKENVDHDNEQRPYKSGAAEEACDDQASEVSGDTIDNAVADETVNALVMKSQERGDVSSVDPSGRTWLDAVGDGLCYNAEGTAPESAAVDYIPHASIQLDSESVQVHSYESALNSGALVGSCVGTTEISPVSNELSVSTIASNHGGLRISSVGSSQSVVADDEIHEHSELLDRRTPRQLCVVAAVSSQANCVDF